MGFERTTAFEKRIACIFLACNWEDCHVRFVRKVFAESS